MSPNNTFESLGEEIVADAKAFIQSAETDLIADAEAAGAWLMAELRALEPMVLADLKVAVSSAVTEAVSTGSAASTVTDTLNILARDGMDVLAKVKSDVVVAVVGLTSAKPAAP